MSSYENDLWISNKSRIVIWILKNDKAGRGNYSPLSMKAHPNRFHERTLGTNNRLPREHQGLGSQYARAPEMYGVAWCMFPDLDLVARGEGRFWRETAPPMLSVK